MIRQFFQSILTRTWTPINTWIPTNMWTPYGGCPDSNNDKDSCDDNSKCTWIGSLLWIQIGNDCSNDPALSCQGTDYSCIICPTDTDDMALLGQWPSCAAIVAGLGCDYPLFPKAATDFAQ